MPEEEIDLETVDTDSELAKQQEYQERREEEESNRLDEDTENIIKQCFRNSPFLQKMYEDKSNEQKSIMRSTIAIAIYNTIIYYNVR